MREIRLHTERCKACGYCIHFCPKKAISQQNSFNQLGYKIITIDEEKCVGCGTCFVVCPDSVIEIINDPEAL
ncbi:MAG: 4Fe-4S binding protein [Erysipelotrichaceae bacterium]|nr:4Fe-4S binding protein [Erysipelotrichaceae bacterium]